MRLVLRWIDRLRTVTAEGLPAFAGALSAQLEEMVATANLWAAQDHTPDGTHQQVTLMASESTPMPVRGGLVLYFDGTDLKVVRANGTTGTVTIT